MSNDKIISLLICTILLLSIGSCTLRKTESKKNSVPLKIMPLGDSITQSTEGYASYRYWLWKKLIGEDYSVDFVGSLQIVHNGIPLYSYFDQEHEGRWGWKVNEVQAKIDEWVEIYKPDIVLVHLGTNDIFQDEDPKDVAREIDLLIDTLRKHNKYIKIAVAQIIPSTNSGDQIKQFNEYLPKIINSKNTAKSPVILVDQWSNFDAVKYTWDGVHPNELGEKKMAEIWYKALVDSHFLARN